MTLYHLESYTQQMVDDPLLLIKSYHQWCNDFIWQVKGHSTSCGLHGSSLVSSTLVVIAFGIVLKFSLIKVMSINTVYIYINPTN